MSEAPLELLAVPRQLVQTMWPRLEPFVLRAVRRGVGRLDAQGVRSGAIDGSHVLWVISRGEQAEEIVAVGASTILRFPSKAVLSVFMYSGSRAEAQHLWPVIEAYGRKVGCAEIQIAGPRAWLRIGGGVFAKVGFREAYTVFTKEL